MEKICADVHKILGFSNVYLITGEKNILIDTGDANDKGLVKSKIEKIIPLEKVDVVLLTHLHFDHAGNVDLFKNAKFYASFEEIENYKNSSKDFFMEKIPKDVDEILRNKLIPLEDEIFGMTVIECPGHTRGSVAFLDEKRKILFSGDTIFERGIGRTDLPNSIPEKMEESVKKLIDEVHEKKLKICAGHDY